MVERLQLIYVWMPCRPFVLARQECPLNTAHSAAGVLSDWWNLQKALKQGSEGLVCWCVWILLWSTLHMQAHYKVFWKIPNNLPWCNVLGNFQASGTLMSPTKQVLNRFHPLMRVETEMKELIWNFNHSQTTGSSCYLVARAPMTSSMLCLRRETKSWQMPYEVLLTKALFFHYSKTIKREKPETSTAAFHLLQGKVSDVRPNIYKLYFG